MKIFLSGSTSFLGLKFINLYKNKYDIFGFSKHDSQNSIDVLDKVALNKAFDNAQPDAVIHLAAIVDQTGEKVKDNNIQGTNKLVDLAKSKQIPFIFMSSESVYGGKEETGDYKETDEYKPRSVYAETKVESEKLVKSSNVPYLILRAHRFVGINRSYKKPKQFPDTLKALEKGRQLHLDSKKLFKPCFINHISEVFDHYLQNDSDKRHILNIGVNKETTYCQFIKDIAKTFDLDESVIHTDGEETGWPKNSTLNIEKLYKLGYPTLEYEELLNRLRDDYFE